MLGLVFPPRPRSGRERGTSWSPSVCDNTDYGLSPLPGTELKWGRGRALSYLCSQRASREAAEEPTTCAHVPAGKEPAVRKNTLVIGERAAATIRGRVCGSGGGEEICEALPDSIQKDRRERQHGE